MQDNRAFQQMLLSAKERICVHAPEEIAQKSGAVFHKDKSFFELQSLAQRIQITFPESFYILLTIRFLSAIIKFPVTHDIVLDFLVCIRDPFSVLTKTIFS